MERILCTLNAIKLTQQAHSELFAILMRQAADDCVDEGSLPALPFMTTADLLEYEELESNAKAKLRMVSVWTLCVISPVIKAHIKHQARAFVSLGNSKRLKFFISAVLNSSCGMDNVRLLTVFSIFSCQRKHMLVQGGDSTQQQTSRILRSILSWDVAKDYSWYGAKGKKKFSDLNICKLLCSK